MRRKSFNIKKINSLAGKQPLKAAVLFIVFNRLDITKQVFEAIREAKPPKLYIAADGARESKEDEEEKVKAVRDFVINGINWKCEVKTLFREKNLGCKYAVSGAIDWFFKNEEMGIILEDDCFPSQSFFWFCEELLEKYKDDERIMHISGDNFQNGFSRGDGNFYFSRHIHVWGWASWRRAWKYYDVKIKSYPRFVKQNLIQTVWKNKKDQKYWLKNFSKVFKNRLDTWDYQWTFTVWSQNGLSILPNVNLISNIGFGVEATHTTVKSSSANLPKFEIDTLNYPSFVLANITADHYTNRNLFSTIFLKRLFNRVRRIFSR
jgi:hypothetical protein